jgi:hypothetical protein
VTDVDAVWADVRADCMPSEVRRIEHYLGDLFYKPAETWSQPGCAKNWVENRTLDVCAMGQKADVVLNCTGQPLQLSATLTGMRVPPQTMVLTYGGQSARSVLDRMVKDVASDVNTKQLDVSPHPGWCNVLKDMGEIWFAALRKGYECLFYETVATTYMNTGSGEDDLTGAHVTPILVKNRPLVPRELWDDPLIHRGGALLPFTTQRHWEPVLLAAIAEADAKAAGQEIGFDNRLDVAFWRGKPTYGPSYMAVLQQSCGGQARAHHEARGAPGDLFRTGLPHECRSMSQMMRESNKVDVPIKALAACERLSSALPGKGSRFELVRLWGTQQALTGLGIDVAFSNSIINNRIDMGVVNCNIARGLPESTPMNIRIAITPTPISEQIRFKYLIVVSGMDKATNLNWVLWTDSVPLMPPPVDESWLCESWLEPWVHYVPLRPDFSDVAVKLD